MTAAHCACSLKKTDPDDEPKPHENAICKPFDKNQIVSGYNQIEIHGGHMNKDELQKQENDENTFAVFCFKTGLTHSNIVTSFDPGIFLKKCNFYNI